MPEVDLRSMVIASLWPIAMILGVMAVVWLIEIAIPLRRQSIWARAHLGPNLALTFITFATNIVFNIALVLSLTWVQSVGFGLLNAFPIPTLWASVATLLVLDFSFYVAHVAMHKVPLFWRVHGVHHSDPAVDVTTTIRQHPVEGVIRYAFMAAFAIPFGAGPAAFAIYRSASAINGLFEHANIGTPLWIDRALSWVTTWPYMHKIHHSRDRRQTDTNYGNLFSIWDRLFMTFTPSRLGVDVDYGLSGRDDVTQQKLSGLLAMPFRTSAKSSSQVGAVHSHGATH